jgi:ABC-type transport system involved in multi-copper enzyme maturation permease subunit
MNPLLNYHLYKSARKRRFYWLLSLYLLVIGLLALLFSALTTASSLFDLETDPRISMLTLFTQGQVLYRFSGAILLITAWLLIPINAMGAIAGEREHRTLDLLLITTLPTRSMILGKLGAALITGMLYILAPLPLLLSGYWIGGVTPLELGITFWVILVTMIAKTAWAIYLSARVKRTITAVFIFYGLALATIPLAGIIAILYNVLFNYWRYNNALPAQPLLIEALIQHGWIILSALHPFVAAVVSEGLWLEEGSWFLIHFPVERRILNPLSNLSTSTVLGTATLPSPWIPYTILSLLTAIFMIWTTARRLSRSE